MLRACVSASKTDLSKHADKLVKSSDPNVFVRMGEACMTRLYLAQQAISCLVMVRNLNS